ncbi:LamG-like jellyroll fold domain-containing protein [Deinococcus apachensis]|uniref:LamG-like jellyroll fold domain-containing protein n=1 Tax=Deinococcus apachensis TaxID=309886 RepID=UPI00037769BC|nr:LamG-like jellyroll fold domain-containing protein [Deinococcus apachensis]
MPGIVQKLTGVTFTDPLLPKLEKDTLATTGTLLLQDYANPATWAGGNPANGATLVDLARGGVNSSVVIDPAWPVTYDGKGFLLPDEGAASNFNGKSYISHPSVLPVAQSFLALAWLRVRLTNPASDDYQGVLGQSVNANNVNAGNQLVLYLRSSGGARGAVSFWDQNGVKYTMNIGSSAVTDGQLVQIGVSVVYSSGNATVTGYVNGAAAGSTVTAGMTGLPAGTGQPFTLGVTSTTFGQAKSRFYRALVENLAVSNRNPLTVVQQDWAANNGRF